MFRRYGIGTICQELIIEEYEIHDGVLEIVDKFTKKSEGSFCIVTCEDSVFPGRITKANYPKFSVSIMQKSEDGWIWPKKRDILEVKYEDIIKVLQDNQILKQRDYHEINDDVLYMEWGE